MPCRLGGEGTQNTRTALRKWWDTPSLTAHTHWHPWVPRSAELQEKAEKGRWGLESHLSQEERELLWEEGPSVCEPAWKYLHLAHLTPGPFCGLEIRCHQAQARPQLFADSCKPRNQSCHVTSMQGGVSVPWQVHLCCELRHVHLDSY